MLYVQKSFALTWYSTVCPPRIDPLWLYHSGLKEYLVPLVSEKVMILTICDPTDHKDGYEGEGNHVHESPDPEPPPYEIGMTSFSIWKSRLDYEASIHVEAIGYQPNETIACYQCVTEGLSIEATEAYPMWPAGRIPGQCLFARSRRTLGAVGKHKGPLWFWSALLMVWERRETSLTVLQRISWCRLLQCSIGDA